MVKLSTEQLASRMASPEEADRLIRVRKYADDLANFIEKELETFSDVEQAAILGRLAGFVDRKRKPASVPPGRETAPNRPPRSPGPRKPAEPSPSDTDVSEALDQCERIITMAEDTDIPDEGQEFCESVAASVREVSETIERTGRVTAKQQQALDNWEAGVGSWATRGEWC